MNQQQSCSYLNIFNHNKTKHSYRLVSAYLTSKLLTNQVVVGPKFCTSSLSSIFNLDAFAFENINKLIQKEKCFLEIESSLGRELVGRGDIMVLMYFYRFFFASFCRFHMRRHKQRKLAALLGSSRKPVNSGSKIYRLKKI